MQVPNGMGQGVLKSKHPYRKYISDFGKFGNKVTSVGVMFD